MNTKFTSALSIFFVTLFFIGCDKEPAHQNVVEYLIKSTEFEKQQLELNIQDLNRQKQFNRPKILPVYTEVMDLKSQSDTLITILANYSTERKEEFDYKMGIFIQHLDSLSGPEDEETLGLIENQLTQFHKKAILTDKLDRLLLEQKIYQIQSYFIDYLPRKWDFRFTRIRPFFEINNKKELMISVAAYDDYFTKATFYVGEYDSTQVKGDYYIYSLRDTLAVYPFENGSAVIPFSDNTPKGLISYKIGDKEIFYPISNSWKNLYLTPTEPL